MSSSWSSSAAPEALDLPVLERLNVWIISHLVSLAWWFCLQLTHTVLMCGHSFAVVLHVVQTCNRVSCDAAHIRHLTCSVHRRWSHQNQKDPPNSVECTKPPHSWFPHHFKALSEHNKTFNSQRREPSVRGAVWTGRFWQEEDCSTIQKNFFTKFSLRLLASLGVKLTCGFWQNVRKKRRFI